METNFSEVKKDVDKFYEMLSGCKTVGDLKERLAKKIATDLFCEDVFLLDASVWIDSEIGDDLVFYLDKKEYDNKEFKKVRFPYYGCLDYPTYNTENNEVVFDFSYVNENGDTIQIEDVTLEEFNFEVFKSNIRNDVDGYDNGHTSYKIRGNEDEILKKIYDFNFGQGDSWFKDFRESLHNFSYDKKSQVASFDSWAKYINHEDMCIISKELNTRVWCVNEWNSLENFEMFDNGKFIDLEGKFHPVNNEIFLESDEDIRLTMEYIDEYGISYYCSDSVYYADLDFYLQFLKDYCPKLTENETVCDFINNHNQEKDELETTER